MKITHATIKTQGDQIYIEKNSLLKNSRNKLSATKICCFPKQEQDNGYRHFI